MFGLTFDLESSDKLVISIVYPKTSDSCAFAIGQLFVFDCEKSSPAVPAGVQVSVEAPNHRDHIIRKYTFMSTSNILDTLKLYKEKTIIVLKLQTVTIRFPEIKLFDCGSTSGNSPGLEAIEAAQAVDNSYKYSCSAPLGEIFLNSQSITSNTIYCSQTEWRDASDDTKGSRSLKPYCYATNPPNILPLNFGCNDAKKFCYESSGTSAPSKTSDPTGNVIFTVSVSDPKNIEIKLAFPKTSPSCEFAIGSQFKFNCLSTSSQKVNGLTINVVIGGHPTINYRKFNVVSSKDHVIDVLKLYKENVKFFIRLPNELATEHLDLFDCSLAQGQPPGEEAFEPDVPTTNKNERSCASYAPLNTVFLKGSSTSKSSIFCASEGWRGDDGTIAGLKGDKPFCYSSTPPGIQPLLTSCTGGKFCYESDGSTAPVAATNENAHVIFTVDTSDPKKIEIKLAYPKSSTSCKFELGTKSSFDCSQTTTFKTPSGLQFSGTMGAHPKVNYRRFYIESTTDAVFDILKLYEEEVKFFLRLPKEFASPVVKLFDCSAASGTKPDIEAIETTTTAISTERRCSAPLWEIFFKGVTSSTDKVFCSLGGWRDKTGIKKADVQDKPFCFSSSPPRIQPLLANCDSTKDQYCFESDGGSRVVAATNENAVILFTIDFWNRRKVEVKLAFPNSHASCELGIGSKFKFNCDNPASSENDLKIDVVKGGHPQINFRKFIISSKTTDSVADILKLYEEKPKLTLRLPEELASPELVLFDCKSAAGTPHHVEAIEAPISSSNDNEFRCAAPLGEIFLKGTTTASSVVYCSNGGWRSDAGKVVGDAKDKPFCYSTNPPNIQPLLTNCGSAKNKYCYGSDGTNAAVETTNEKDAIIFAVDFSTPKKVEVRVAIPNTYSTCELAIGNTLKIDCLKTEAQTVQGLSITTVKGGHPQINYRKLFIASNTDPVIDILKLYKEKPKIVLRLPNMELSSSELDLFDCSKVTGNAPHMEAIDPVISPQNTNEISCAAPLGEIFIDGQTTKSALAFCSHNGWRDDAGKLLAATGKRPFCYSTTPPNIQPLLMNCGVANNKYCYESDGSKDPTVTSNEKATVVFAVDFSDAKKIEIRLAWPKASKVCEFEIGTNFKISCAETGKLAAIRGLEINGVHGGHPTINYRKFFVESKTSDPVIDILTLYKENMKLVLRLDKDLISPEIQLFDCSKATGSAPHMEAIDPVVSSSNVNELQCSKPLGEIFINNAKATTKNVYCAHKNWRDEEGTIVGDKAKKPFCYSTNPPNIQPILTGCGTNKHCFESDGTKSPVSATSETSTVIFAIDVSNAMELEVRLAWPKTYTTCEFSIGDNFMFDCSKNDPTLPVSGLEIDTVKGGHPLINYRKFKIKSNSDPVIDILELYKQHVKFTISLPQKLTSAEVQLFKCAGNIPHEPSIEAIDTVISSTNPNEHLCSAPLGEIFVNKATTASSGVFCSNKGWRDDAGKLFGTTADKPYCYSTNPPNIQPMLPNCDTATKFCFESDGTTAPIALANEKAKVIFTIDISDNKKMEVRLAWPKSVASCEFSIGTALKFNCDKGDGITPAGVLNMEKVDGGHPITNYRKFTFTSVDAEQSVIDVLQLFRKKHKLVMKLGTSIETAEISFFDCKALGNAAFSLSKRSAAATKSANLYLCNDPILTTIHVDDANVGVSKVWCSIDGWRRDDNNKVVAMIEKTPSCYTNAPKSSLPFFDECAIKMCYGVNGNALKMISAPDPDQTGVWLDTVNDEKWTVTIAHETHTKFKIRDGEWECKPNVDITSSNVKIKHEESGQDGHVIYHRCTLTPKQDDKSIIDNLQLYMDDYSKVILMGASQITSDDILFFEKCQSDVHRFKHDRIPLEATNVQPHSNKYSCGTGRYIFLNDRFIEDKTVYCSKLGWRNSQHKLEKVFEKEKVFCYTLCDVHFMKSNPTTFDNVVYDVKPKTQNGKISYACNIGGSAVKYNEKLYDSFTCSDNKWKFGDENILMQYENDYSFGVSCVSAKMFRDDNCLSKEEKNTGCDELLFGADNKQLFCKPGYLLMLSDNFYEKIVFEKGDWQKADQNNVLVNIEKADITNKPTCISRCAIFNVNTDAPAQHKFVENAIFSFDLSKNTGELTCKEKEYLLISSFDSTKKGHNTPYECSTTGWKVKTGAVLKALPNVKTRSDLEVTAHCFNVCDKSKLINDCKANNDCIEFKFESNVLSCPSGYALFIETDTGKKQMDKNVQCSSKGWVVQGDTNPMANYDMSPADREKQIKVECVSKCAKRFRTLNNNKPTESGVDLKCSETTSLQYAGDSMAPKHILSDLKCDPLLGWKDQANAILINFATNKYSITAECKESCEATALNPTCTSAQTNCKKPDFDANSKSFSCPDKTTVLTYKKQKYMDAIKCGKDAYKSSDSSITQSRTTTNDKIDLACTSNCDEVFIDKKTCAGSNCITSSYDPSFNLQVECTQPNHYTKMTFGTSVMHTAGNFVCDPKSGWTSTEKEKFASDFAMIQKGSDKIEVECHNICANRIDSTCAHAAGNCATPLGESVVTCPATHSMEIQKMVPLIREQLKCSKNGYSWKNGTMTDFTFDAVSSTVAKKFKVNCVDNCLWSYISKTIKNAVLEKEPKRRQGQKDLYCENEQLLMIGDTRVFDQAECEPAKGYVNSAAKTKTYVDFNQKVLFSAICVDVCSLHLITDLCDGSADCQKVGTGAIRHDTNYRLMFNHKEIMESTITCSRKGWKAGPTQLIDFTDPQIDTTKKVEVHNIHKCNAFFIGNSCKPADATSKKCSEAKRDKRKWTCPNADEILVIEYNGVEKEAFDELHCSDGGWKDEKGSLLHAIAGEKDTPYHVKIRCEQVCHESNLKPISCASGEACELEKKRSYSLGAELTCGTLDNGDEIATDSVLKVTHSDIQPADQEQYGNWKCSKKGWTNEKTGALVISFKPDVARNNLNAQCVKSLCVRPHLPACPQGEDVICENPEFKKVKYEASCADGLEIMLADSTSYTRLECRQGDWFSPGDTTPKLTKTDPFKMECFAGKCSKCAPLADYQIKKCKGKRNCDEVTFLSGSSKYCSQYKCPHGSSFLINDNIYVRVNVNEKVVATHIDGDRCTYYGGSVSVNQIGCVKHIPCYEKTKLEVEASLLDQLKADFEAIFSSGAHKKSKCPDPSHHLYLDHKNKTFSKIDYLQCNKDGGYDTEFEGSSNDKKEVPPMTRIMCSSVDPNEPTVPPTTTTTTEPPPDETRPCDYCPDLPVFECDGCKTENGTITKKNVNRQCEATSPTGRIAFNDADSETTKPVVCQMDENGNFVWKTDEGKVVLSMSARKEKLVDKINTGSIVAIVLVPLIIIIAVGAAIAFVFYKRKKEAELKETMVSKGLEQRNDEVIDAISVEDPKTLIL